MLGRGPPARSPQPPTSTPGTASQSPCPRNCQPPHRSTTCGAFPTPHRAPTQPSRMAGFASPPCSLAAVPPLPQSAPPTPPRRPRPQDSITFAPLHSTLLPAAPPSIVTLSAPPPQVPNAHFPRRPSPPRSSPVPPTVLPPQPPLRPHCRQCRTLTSAPHPALPQDELPFQYTVDIAANPE